MTTEFNELLSTSHGDKLQIWIIGDRDQVIHAMNEFCVKRIATDPAKFSPLIPAWFAAGKYIAVLER